MILIIDTDRVVSQPVLEGPTVVPMSGGIVFLNGEFQVVSIAEAIQYQTEKAVEDAFGYHLETYHEDPT